ncbi:Lrp/AsnC family transcriptional regulator [Streptosporangium pseudovulgare]|uniref:AsnC family transcriptional regulator n=1 Tax=Streptosporangium pseudovulgare TaxID=35765 RepID=A0ABQ2R153_9ACTN|nr:Lrp/AsnC family transcriptional regulator [Streptosporangium pseudovulgare]GGQ04657.1 AsnC family transcriptional regulator [Streptosporangium pseudovulgare]
MQPGVPVDELDRAIVAALQLNGRAPWSLVARLVGASESTVVRRAAVLGESGMLRVIGVVDVLRCGLGVPVLTRFRCRPGTTYDVAGAIAARPEARFVAVVSGAADCVAEFVVPNHAALGRVMIADMPGGDRVIESETHAVIRTFVSNHDWNPGVLDPEAAAELRDAAELPFEDRFRDGSPERLDELEQAIVQVLGQDGRMPYKALAAAVGSSESTAKRRVESLVRRGCLRFRTLAEPEVLGYAVEFMLWLEVEPGRLETTGQQLAAHPLTRYLSATTGRFNLAAQVALRHYGDLFRYMTDDVGSLPGLRAADVTLQLTTFKRAWVPTPAARSDRKEP